MDGLRMKPSAPFSSFSKMSSMTRLNRHRRERNHSQRPRFGRAIEAQVSSGHRLK
ncbi:hypothetical protein SynA1544_01227 [Synechococcus sp. A15-44]|nr:hypothetical protein SynA1544_01167 [Synechococcus sp. A15-44]QNI64167.1 hypothetical protein SynA1544_01227 [Synechococcus sp. A15-44]